MKNFFNTALALLFCLFLSPCIHAQDPLWGASGGGAGDEQGNKVVADAQGNAYVLGSFTGTVTFRNFKLTSRGDADLFLVKYDWTGKPLWAKQIGGTGRETPEDMVIDNLGNLYITATFFGLTQIGSDTMSSSGGMYGVTDIFLTKTDPSGNFQWTKKIQGPGMDYYPRLQMSPDNKLVYLSANLADGTVMDWGRFDVGYSPTYSGTILRYKTDTGYLDGFFSFGGGYDFNLQIRGMKPDGKGNMYVTGIYTSSLYLSYDSVLYSGSTSDYSFFIAKLDLYNNFVWAKQYGQASSDVQSIGLDSSGHLYVAGTVSSYINIDGQSLYVNGHNDLFLAKFDTTGKVVWAKTGGSPSYSSDDEVHGMETDSAGNCFLIGYSDNSTGLISSQGLFVAKIDPNGKQVWTLSRGYGDLSNYQCDARGLFIDRKGKGWLSGNYACVNGSSCLSFGNYKLLNNGSMDMFVASFTDTTYTGANENLISGRVYADLNKNCKSETSDMNLPFYVVKAAPGPYYAVTNSQGKYRMRIPKTGTVGLTQYIPERDTLFIKPKCIPASNVNFSGYGNAVYNQSFGDSIRSCFQLTASVVPGQLRRCASGITRVSYCNAGNASASGVLLKVVFPEFVLPVSSSVPWTMKNGDTVSFQLNTLAAGACGSIEIVDSVKCIADIAGLSQCIQAVITPRSACVFNDPRWDKSKVEVSGRCLPSNDKIFTIRNTGSNMADSAGYRIFFNNTLGNKGKFKLKGNDSTQFVVPASIYTVRLEADQAPYYPYADAPVVEMQYCHALNKSYSPGQVNQKYVTGRMPEQDIFCGEITDISFPDHKIAAPSGTTTQHFISPNDQVEYLIEFQNNGSDTAFALMVRDTLDAMLDLSTMSGYTTSHACDLTVSGSLRPVLTCACYGINLPDSAHNFARSQGYVRFKLKLQKNVPKGYVVTNKAYVYFDYNKPVVSNEVFYTIQDTVITDLSLGSNVHPPIVTAVLQEYQFIGVGVYPNPTSGYVSIVSHQEAIQAIQVYDALGTEVLNRKSNSYEEMINLEDHPAGVYFLKLFSVSGKMSLEKIVKK